MKTPRSYDFIRELYKLFKELVPILHNLFRKQKRKKGYFPTHCYSGSNDKAYRRIFLTDMDTKILKQIISYL